MICYFNDKYFLILLKSCVTTLDKKNQEGHCDCLQQLHHFECVVKTKAWNHVPGQNCFRGFQEVCKDEIFEYIVGRNHLNFVNHKILMFLMIKVPMYVIAIDTYYFKNKYFLILLKSCITTLDMKEPRFRVFDWWSKLPFSQFNICNPN